MSGKNTGKLSSKTLGQEDVNGSNPKVELKLQDYNRGFVVGEERDARGMIPVIKLKPDDAYKKT